MGGTHVPNPSYQEHICGQPKLRTYLRLVEGEGEFAQHELRPNHRGYVYCLLQRQELLGPFHNEPSGLQDLQQGRILL